MLYIVSRIACSWIFWILSFGISSIALAQEIEPLAPLPPEEAARTMIVPDGFHVSLFAGEPDVQQPIGFCIDDRGRLWVAEAFNYPNHGTQPGDRILIFEDTDGDGKFDSRKVFYDQLNYVTGVEVGFGGVWVMSPPYFYFIADANADDVPDGPPKILLDGFGNHANSHNLANGFAWGPDGWLYGTHGRTNWSRIGRPGTPDDQRVQFDGGVYRYHPIRHVWEPYADGTTNPWGIDWDDYGEGFVCNCVNPHLFHVIQGAHYEPWRNRPSSQHAFQRIETIADHLHFVGEWNARDSLGSQEVDAAGGGHAHCGTMIYLGDNWPAEYRNSVFMNNIHGKRINQDRLRRSGSGYVASHAPDLVRSRDPWHMGVTLQYGPDGGVFVLDWSDTGECHSVRNTRRETGRIFKVTYDRPRADCTDLKLRSNAELVQLQHHKNDWFVRHARRLLQERFATGSEMQPTRESLKSLLNSSVETPQKLRAFWALQVVDGLDEDFLLQQLSHPSEHLRAWSIRFLCESGKPGLETLGRLKSLAIDDPSPIVRLYLASGLQRLAPEQCWPIAKALLQHAEDSKDQNLPLMYWYAVEPLIDDRSESFVDLALQAKIPLLRNFIARRALTHKNGDAYLLDLLQAIRSVDDPEIHRDVLEGILKGLEGRRTVAMPVGWSEQLVRFRASPRNDVRQSAIELALVFGDPNAQRILREQAVDPQVADQDRRRAVQSLVAKRFPKTADFLLTLVEDLVVRQVAVRGLAEFEHEQTATTLVRLYPGFDPSGKQDILQTLASRRAWAMGLLHAMEAGTISRKDVTAYTARQLQSLGDRQVEQRMKAIWGEIRSTPTEKIKQIADYKKRFSPEVLRAAQLTNGRLLFQKSCGNCHRFFGEGGTIGPDITGSQRMNIDYLLENLIDPSAMVAKDFQMELLVTSTGRTLTGLIVEENDQAVTVQMVNEKLVVPQTEIENRRQSPLSLMPEGILQPMSFEQIRDLLAYLASPAQVPILDQATSNRGQILDRD